TIARIQGVPEKAKQKNGHRRGGVTISGLMKLKDLSMLDPIGLSRLGRTVLVAASIAALAGTSVAFDNMSAEQRAALETAQAEAADETGTDAAADTGGERTIFDGVYTAVQAERGQGFFGSDCA